MPHLSFETFVSQYFWLVLFLLILYYLISTQYIPLISETIKARKRLEAVKTAHQKIAQTDNIKNLLKDIVAEKYTATKSNISYSTLYNSKFSSWSSSL